MLDRPVAIPDNALRRRVRGPTRTSDATTWRGADRRPLPPTSGPTATSEGRP